LVGVPTPADIPGPARRRVGVLADVARLAMQGLLRPLARGGRFSPSPLRVGRRLVLLQLDGVSRERLDRALRDGLMPFLARRLASGRHVLSSCRSGAPASTPAFQAGLFYGVSPSVPAFVWVDRDSGRTLRMDRAADAARVERRLPRRGPGLLRRGTGYFSVFSGDAALTHFCLSGLAGELDLEWYERHMGATDAVAAVLAHTVTAARTVVRLAAEAGAGAVDGLRWSYALGRTRHEGTFFFHRLLVNALLREVAVQGMLVDLSRGIPVLYADFLGYDEHAHRRGPGSRSALRHLAAADGVLELLFSAAEAVPELGYDVYLISDHGHVATRPFEELTGMPLPELVVRAERGQGLPRGVPTPRRARSFHAEGTTRRDGIAVAEAGDLAHVYFLRDRGPLPVDAVRARHGRVLAALGACPAVGLLGVRGGSRGLAVAGGRILDLAAPEDVARLPHPDPPLLATYLSDLLSLRDAGDLVVLGWRGAERENVAYAWEFGSHGGVAPEELSTFVVHPRGVDFPFHEVVRPSELNAFFEARYRSATEEEPAREARP
jgi:hypothetical protein